MKIAILSRNGDLYSTRRFVEAAQQYGHEAQVIDHLRCNIEIEQKGPSLYYGSGYLEGFDAVIPRIGASVAPSYERSASSAVSPCRTLRTS